MRNGATPDDLFLDEVDHDEILVGCVEERQQREGEAGSDGEELTNLLVNVRRSHLLAAGAIDGDDVGVACEEDTGCLENIYPKNLCNTAEPSCVLPHRSWPRQTTASA